MTKFVTKNWMTNVKVMSKEKMSVFETQHGCNDTRSRYHSSSTTNTTQPTAHYTNFYIKNPQAVSEAELTSSSALD